MTRYLSNRDEFHTIHGLIRPHIRITPVIEVDGADFRVGDSSVTLKLELMQHSGSFKCRGAFGNLLTREIPQSGVVAEPGGSAAFAGLLCGKYRPRPRERVGVVIIGRNTTAVDFSH